MTERQVSGATRLAGVIGNPIGHSLSPAIFNAAFAATGLDWIYLAFDVASGRAAGALDAMRTLGLAGLSVTMPHKDAIAELVDHCTPEAAALLQRSWQRGRTVSAPFPPLTERPPQLRMPPLAYARSLLELHAPVPVATSAS